MRPDERFLARQWLNGRGSALPLVRQLLNDERPDESAATARLALHMEDCHDRDALEAALLESASAPDGWLAALENFAKSPSETQWEELMRFVPYDVFYQRLDAFLAWASISEIRREADDALNEELDKVVVPRV